MQQDEEKIYTCTEDFMSNQNTSGLNMHTTIQTASLPSSTRHHQRFSEVPEQAG